MTWLLVATGAAVAFGAAVAVGAGGARTAGLGALVALVFSPFVADPLPPAPVLGFRIVAGGGGGGLLAVAARRAGPASGSPIGLPATVAAAIAAFVAGLGATAVGLPSFGPQAAVAAGLACVAVAVAPVALARDAFRLGAGLLVLLNAALLLRAGLVGTPPALDALVAGAALVAIAVAVMELAGSAATAAGELAIPDAVIDRRRPPG